MRVFAFFASLSLAASLCAQSLDIQKSRVRLHSDHSRISRCVRYDIYGEDIPQGLDGLTMAFVTDVHYASRFDDKGLRGLGNALRELNADVILLGGDYQEGCEYVEPLFSEIMSAKPRYGAYGVLGNNDYERCTDVIAESMSRNGITLLENSLDTISVNGSRLIVAGAKNIFRYPETVPSPTANLKPEDFVVLLSHTPDYFEDVDISNTDLALAGHLHGGQVTLFGLWAPILPSRYGQRFRTGLKYNSSGIPMVISNGIGTSRKNIRLFAPSEIHYIVIHVGKTGR